MSGLRLLTVNGLRHNRQQDVRRGLMELNSIRTAPPAPPFPRQLGVIWCHVQPRGGLTLWQTLAITGPGGREAWS